MVLSSPSAGSNLLDQADFVIIFAANVRSA